MIHLVGVAKSFGKQALFAAADLHLSDGDRVGVVGANGTGKTTLFRLIAGEVPPDEGEIHLPRGLRIGYLRQEVIPGQQGQLLDYVMHSVRGLDALIPLREQLMDRLDHAAGEEAETLAKRLADVEDRFAHAGGYEIESEARGVLDGLGFVEEDLSRPLSAWDWRFRTVTTSVCITTWTHLYRSGTGCL